MGLNMKDFASRFEGVANIVGAYIESSIKEKGAFETQVKSIVKGFEDYITQSIAEKMKDIPVENREVTLRVKKLENFKGELPQYESELAAGIDVRAQLSEDLVLEPGERTLVPTGLAFEIPEGFEIQARPRSGWAIKEGVSLVNSPGTIDADYRGEVKIIIINHGQKPVTIEDQHRVAQLVVAPVIQADFEEVEELSETERGAGGFGSTGKKATH